MNTFDINNSIHAAAYKLAARHFLSSTHEDWEASRLFNAIESDEDSDDWLTCELDRDQVNPWVGIEASCEHVMLDPWVRLQEYIVGLAEDFIKFRTASIVPPASPSHRRRRELREGFIGDVAISHITIKISKELENVTLLDLGGVYLSCEGREYIMDISDSCWDIEDGCTEITCGLKTFDEDEIFEECPFDLTGEDLFSSSLKASVFVGDEEAVTEGEEMTATLFVERNGCTHAIELAFE